MSIPAISSLQRSRLLQERKRSTACNASLLHDLALHCNLISSCLNLMYRDTKELVDAESRINAEENFREATKKVQQAPTCRGNLSSLFVQQLWRRKATSSEDMFNLAVP